MHSCQVVCPYCDLVFEQVDIVRMGKTSVICKFCKGVIDLTFEMEISSNVYTPSKGDKRYNEFKNQRTLSQNKKNNFYIIKLDDVYMGENQHVKLVWNAKCFLNKESAEMYMRLICQPYPNAEVLQYGVARDKSPNKVYYKDNSND